MLNMFRTLIYPYPGACDCAVELTHRSSCSQFVVLEFWCGWFYVVLVLQAEACGLQTGTTQNQPHQISNTQRTENKTTDVVIQQHSRRLLMMDILMSETCWAHKKWNKIASDIKLVFHSSNIVFLSAYVLKQRRYSANFLPLSSKTLEHSKFFSLPPKFQTHLYT